MSSDDNNQIVLGQFTVPSSAQIAGNVNLLVTSPYDLWQPIERVSFSISPNNIPLGCTDFTACNFAFTLECPSESPCFYPTSTVPCDGSCPDNDFDGLCDLIQLNNAQSQLAQLNSGIQAGNLCGTGTVWSPTQQRCVVLNFCPQDVTSDGHVGIDDILEVLGWFGEDCSTFQSCGLPMEYQGVAYATVSINGTCWFAENLKCIKYSNLDSIQSNLNPEEWSSTALGATAIYGDSLYGCLDSLGSIENPACFDTENLSKFGRLYNAYAVNDWRGLCPSGWHVYTDDDWKDVEIFLGMTEFEADHSWWRGTNEGFALKSDSSDVVVWDGNNQSGFSAVPAGKLNPDGFSNGFFWGRAGLHILDFNLLNGCVCPCLGDLRDLGEPFTGCPASALRDRNDISCCLGQEPWSFSEVRQRPVVKYLINPCTTNPCTSQSPLYICVRSGHLAQLVRALP